MDTSYLKIRLLHHPRHGLDVLGPRIWAGVRRVCFLAGGGFEGSRSRGAVTGSKPGLAGASKECHLVSPSLNSLNIMIGTTAETSLSLTDQCDLRMRLITAFFELKVTFRWRSASILFEDLKSIGH